MVELGGGGVEVFGGVGPVGEVASGEGDDFSVLVVYGDGDAVAEGVVGFSVLVEAGEAGLAGGVGLHVVFFEEVVPFWGGVSELPFFPVGFGYAPLVEVLAGVFGLGVGEEELVVVVGGVGE